ncbi:SMAD/FHA domain [Plasmopara halstedii]|uniref:SMAD/FHA domain n=1 Tax=Plasmopara halstedii TaxID=4781 RepID=A0A0P1AQQ0_PLAHL|nr:SMAD/FHA domain [Plasmopara halstedii]CEG43874.1 SMAD/FHA domain [Plasmopara halstedii]|eukprot:XP_024580243.1 SMAD/FHA domain [Plasmopara halstedii]
MASLVPKLLPWGRLVLLTKSQKEPLPENYDLSRSKHCVGRVANRSDIHIPKQFISGIHCIIRLLGKNDMGEALVEIEDLSRYGVWVNLRKVGHYKKATLRNGYVIHFTPPESKDVSELAYKFELLPDGLTKENEALHARMSADEMSVASRTRKRFHEELQCTQSPTKVVPTPLRPRPAKKQRQVSIYQQSNQDEPVKEPDNGHIVTSATQQSRLTTKETHSPTKKSAGKRRRRSEEPASESKLAKLQKQNDELKDVITENAVTLIKQLRNAQNELEALRKENEALKKAREEDIAALKELHEEEVERLKGQAAVDLARIKEQAKKKEDLLQQECSTLKKALDYVVNDPKMPHQIRTIFELEANIQELKHQLKTEQEDQAFHLQHQDRPQLTPPSRKQLVELERKAHVGRQLCISQEETGRMIRQMYLQVNERLQEEMKMSESITKLPSSLSGSSQSQDSIDQRHSDHRSSQLSEASNEHSVTSPTDPPLTIDVSETETKSGETSLGRPPLFTIFGAHSTTADTGNNTIKPAILSQPDLYRARGAKRAEERKGVQDENEDEEATGRD